MDRDRYRDGGAEQQLPGCCTEIEEISDPSEKRYATLATRGNRDRRRDRTGGSDRPATEGGRTELRDPLLEIARYDERHHYGRHSIERREERLVAQRRRQERLAEQRRRQEGDLGAGASSRSAERRHHRYGSQS